MSKRSTDAATRSVKSGLMAEWLAIGFLLCKGYRPLARRYGGKGGEIDVIARRGRLIIFVEVKARAAMTEAQIAITPGKIRLMTRRIRDWQARNPWARGLTLRADAVFIGKGVWPLHVPDVFPLELS